MTDTYQLTYHCTNCEHSCTVRIPKGRPAPDTAECTHCGCKTAHRHKPSRENVIIPLTPSRPWRRPPIGEEDRYWLRATPGKVVSGVLSGGLYEQQVVIS